MHDQYSRALLMYFLVVVLIMSSKVMPLPETTVLPAASAVSLEWNILVTPFCPLVTTIKNASQPAAPKIRSYK